MAWQRKPAIQMYDITLIVGRNSDDVTDSNLLRQRLFKKCKFMHPMKLSALLYSFLS